jgi:hypothetical protein
MDISMYPKINHVNFYHNGIQIYCELNQQVVDADQDFFDNNCRSCPMFNGHAQGEGIECLYPDSLASEDMIDGVTIYDPGFFQMLRQHALQEKGY